MGTGPEDNLVDDRQTGARVPDGQERLATQPERDDVNEKISRSPAAPAEKTGEGDRP